MVIVVLPAPLGPIIPTISCSNSSIDTELTAVSPPKRWVTFSVRSSVESEKRALLDQIACLTKTLGGTVTTNGDYPAWEYLENSPLRDLMCRIFEEQYGRKPIVEALHAGVECGIFAGKIPELDCVSFGPDMKDIHTPKESMDVESVKRTWEYLLEILKQLK